MALRAIHLCAGVGGFELALRGIARTVANVEREAFAAACLVAQMEEQALDPAPVWSDLATFDGRPWRGHVDLITAGFPCQPVSLAGSGLGEEDERWLWPEIARVVRSVEPGFVFLENVPALVSGGTIRSVLRDLALLGFDAEWDLFSAAEVGAPHIRQRIYILAAHPERGLADTLRNDGAQVLPERRQPPGEEPVSDGAQGRVMADAQGSGSPSGDAGQDEREAAEPERFGSQVPDPDSRGSQEQREPEPPGQQRPRGREFDGLREDVPDANSEGLPLSDAEQHPPGEEPAASRSGWWASEPRVGRVADGVPSRVDRLHALGNAVVPATARLAFFTLFERLTG